MKLGIIGGAGLLGSTTAFTVGMRDILDEIKLVDVYENGAKNHAMDMGQALLPLSKTKISAASYADLGDCEILLITANKSTGQVTDRSERLKENAELLSPMTEEIKRYCKSDPVTIVCTNPVDVFTYVTWKMLGFERNKVIGFSSNDTMRLQWAIAEAKQLDYRKLSCICIGEHGDNQVRLTDRILYEGKPLALSKEEEETVIRMTGEWFKEFSGLGVKRTTGWTSAVNLAEMIEAIAKDSGKQIPCSAVFGGEHGYSDVAVGAICSLGRDGIKEKDLPLNDAQKKEMDAAVEKIKSQIAMVKYE